MKKLSVESWVQMATGIAVIIGIGLVVYELEQTRQIAFTEMAQEAMSEITVRETTIAGENAAETLAKACFTPSELNEADKFVLDAVFSSQINFALRIKLLEDTGGINTIWRLNLRQAVDYITSFPQGVTWMEASRSIWDAEFNQAALAAITTRSDVSCRDRIALLDAH